MPPKTLVTKSTRTVQRWFRELEHYGFIVKTAGACLGVDGDGIAVLTALVYAYRHRDITYRYHPSSKQVLS
jgi:hypothetical protein